MKEATSKPSELQEEKTEKRKWAALADDYNKTIQWFSKLVRQPDNDKFIQKLKYKRKGNSISSRKFALAAGIDPSHYAKIEKGELPLTKNVKAELIKQYNITLDDTDSLCAMFGVPFNFGMEVIIFQSLSPVKNAIEQSSK